MRAAIRYNETSNRDVMALQILKTNEVLLISRVEDIRLETMLDG